MRTRSLPGFLVVVSILAACAAPPAYQQTEFLDRNVITAAEIEATDASSAFDLLRKIRPLFLSGRGPISILGNSSSLPTVYIDGMRYGPLSSLREIPASSIADITLYRAGNAAQFGLGNLGGVLAIRTRRDH